jgi:hypothetical protein
VSLSWLGATVQSKKLVDHYVRFHQLINVEAGFFPTAREVRAIVDKTNDNPSVIYVIVGGSSVLHGVGQHESLIWTRFLQDRLGASFRVINFAQRAGWATDFGNIAAEYLLRNSKRVIFVGDAYAHAYTIPLESSFYKHIIFDAWQHNLLLPWAPRDKVLSRALLDDKLRAPALGAFLNGYLNFNDLWNYISLEHANLIWNSLLGEKSFQPRARFADPDLLPEQYARLRYLGDIEATMRIERGQILDATDLQWINIRNLTDQLVPPALRKVTLCVVQIDSPYYRRRLTAAEQEAILTTARTHAELLVGLGFNRALVPTTDFSDDDYVDRVHISALGGQKLAIALTPAIQQMAVELGYLYLR